MKYSELEIGDNSQFAFAAKGQCGLTKREFFAAQMLAALLVSEGGVGVDGGPHTGAREESMRRDARRSVGYADVLIEALGDTPLVTPEIPSDADQT